MSSQSNNRCDNCYLCANGRKLQLSYPYTQAVRLLSSQLSSQVSHEKDTNCSSFVSRQLTPSVNVICHWQQLVQLECI